MDRKPITIINRRRMLAEALDACNSAEVREEVAAHAVKRYQMWSEIYAEGIADAVRDMNAPPAPPEALIDLSAPPKRNAWRGVFWVIAGVLAALICYGLYWSADKTLRGVEAYQGEARRG